MPQYKLDFLNALGYGKDMLIERNIKTPVICKNLYMGTRLGVNNRMITPEGLSLLSTLRKPYPTNNKLIFLDWNDDRKDFRRLLNEEDLWQVCKKFGFERYTPGRMSIAQKQEIFGQASVIVGQYGGGLQNHFLCPKKTSKCRIESNHAYMI